MSNQIEINELEISQWLSEGLSGEEVEKKLIELGYDAEKKVAYTKVYHKRKYAKRQYSGTLLAGVGALLGFISCVLTMLNPIPALHGFFLYGLTSVAVLLVFIGLYLVFE